MAITLNNRGIGDNVGERLPLISLLRKTVYISVVTAIISFSSYLWLAQAEPQYRGRTTIVIEASESSRPVPGADAVDREIVASQAQLIRSRDLARTIVERFDLSYRAEFDPTLRGATPVADFLTFVGLRRDPRLSSPDERVLQQFSRSLSVSTDRSQLLTITFTSRDPQLAAAVPNALAEEYLALQDAALQATRTDGADWLASEIEGLRQRVEQIESDADAYRSRVDRLTDGLAGRTLAETQDGPALTPIARAEIEADLAELEREAVAQRELLDSYLRRYQEALARQQSAGLPVAARVLARASEPTEPYYPKAESLAAAIGLFAFMLMFAAVVIRELARARPMSGDAPVPLPEVADAPQVADRRRWGDDRGVRRIMPAAPSFVSNSEDRFEGSIATAAEVIAAERFKRIMVVTVDDAGNGRPLAGVGLARFMARGERRPVLIDLRCDAANSRSMGEGAALPGFSDLFAGEASFGQVIFRDRESRVHFIPAGLNTLTQGGLERDRVRLLVSALDHTYDHVILDVADDLVETIGSVCDVVVLVSRASDTEPATAPAIERIRAVTNVRVIHLRADSAAHAEPDLAAGGEAA